MGIRNAVVARWRALLTSGVLFASSTIIVAGANPLSIPVAEGNEQGVMMAFKAHRGFDDHLRDYPGARFRNTFVHYRVQPNGGRSWFLCGEVNERNPFGGYRGWTTFSVGLDGGVSIDESDSLIYSQLCGPDPVYKSVTASHTDWSFLLMADMTPARFLAMLPKN